MHAVNRNGIESEILTCGIRRFIERHIFNVNVNLHIHEKLSVKEGGGHLRKGA